MAFTGVNYSQPCDVSATTRPRSRERIAANKAAEEPRGVESPPISPRTFASAGSLSDCRLVSRGGSRSPGFSFDAEARGRYVPSRRVIVEIYARLRRGALHSPASPNEAIAAIGSVSPTSEFVRFRNFRLVRCALYPRSIDLCSTLNLDHRALIPASIVRKLN